MSNPRATLLIQRDVPLSGYTTIGLGGSARYFAACRTTGEIQETLKFAREQRLPVQILAGGSNVIYPDEGFDGLILWIKLRGTSFVPSGNHTLVSAAAGEPWDNFARECVERDLTGIECLSGIPGSVGATPIQNVGAYGQEVRDTIVSLNAVHRETLEEVQFAATECSFGYRMSRFKSVDAERYVVTRVTFALTNHGTPVIRYAELSDYLRSTFPDVQDGGGISPGKVRSAVIALRKRKSMVIDAGDPNSRSVGSFFMNPVLSAEEFKELQRRWERHSRGSIPTFPAEGGVKIPAAWLVERAGFPRGFRSGGAGISSNHSLALVNFGGTTREVLHLAAEIEQAVQTTFAITLQREPVVVANPTHASP